jgi:hypothetical protein
MLDTTCALTPQFDIQLPRTPVVWWGPDTLCFFTVYNTQQDPIVSPHGADPGPTKWGDRVYLRGVDGPQPLAPCDPPRASVVLEASGEHLGCGLDDVAP